MPVANQPYIATFDPNSFAETIRRMQLMNSLPSMNGQASQGDQSTAPVVPPDNSQYQSQFPTNLNPYVMNIPPAQPAELPATPAASSVPAGVPDAMAKAPAPAVKPAVTPAPTAPQAPQAPQAPKAPGQVSTPDMPLPGQPNYLPTPPQTPYLNEPRTQIPATMIPQTPLTQGQYTPAPWARGQGQGPDDYETQRMRQMQAATDIARRAYEAKLQSVPPDKRDYHPGFWRNLAGYTLGAIGGIKDPNLGADIAENVRYGPYHEAMGRYTQGLAQKKDIYDLEEGAYQSEAKAGAELERRLAEKERAGAEATHKQQMLWEMSPEGQAAKLELARATATARQRPSWAEGTVIDQAGNKIPVFYNKAAPGRPQVIDMGTGEDVDPSLIHSFQAKEPTPPKDPVTGEYRDEEAYARSLNLMKSDDPTVGDPSQLTTEQRQRLRALNAIANETPAMRVQREAGGVRGVEVTPAAVYSEFVAARKELIKETGALQKDSNAQMEKILVAEGVLNQATNVGDVTGVFEDLKALVTGQGSGARMTNSEIDRLVRARGLADSWDAFWSGLKGKGVLGSDQRAKMMAILNDVKYLAGEKARLEKEAMDKVTSLEKDSDANDVGRIRIGLQDGFDKLYNSYLTNISKTKKQTGDQTEQDKKDQENIRKMLGGTPGTVGAPGRKQ